MTQTELALDPLSRWGGRREGAGRKRSPHPRMPHLRRSPFAGRFPCHVTLRMRAGLPSLRNGRLVRELERSFREGCERTSFRVVHYSVQSNHLHLLVEADGPQALGRGMKSIGARLARAVNRIFRRRGPVLEDRYHARVLRAPREVRNALAYVLLNARKHIGRLAFGRGVDPASSGRWFDGWKGEHRPTARDAPAVARARTWLLNVGWRRHGLLQRDDVPGRKRGGSTPRPVTSEFDRARESLIEEGPLPSVTRVIRVNDATIRIEIEKMQPSFLVGSIPLRGVPLQ